MQITDFGQLRLRCRERANFGGDKKGGTGSKSSTKLSLEELQLLRNQQIFTQHLTCASDTELL